jgi:hypothetical protein
VLQLLHNVCKPRGAGFFGGAYFNDNEMELTSRLGVFSSTVVVVVVVLIV